MFPDLYMTTSMSLVDVLILRTKRLYSNVKFFCALCMSCQYGCPVCRRYLICPTCPCLVDSLIGLIEQMRRRYRQDGRQAPHITGEDESQVGNR